MCFVISADCSATMMKNTILQRVYSQSTLFILFLFEGLAQFFTVAVSHFGMSAISTRSLLVCFALDYLTNRF